ncbi:MAG: aldehyde dehydrogenase family protein, partial [Anaerovoracaceae bacterium]
MKIKKMYINGKWTEGTSGETFMSVNPANGEINAEIYKSSEKDTKNAIDAAYDAFYKKRDWRDMDIQKRSDTMLKIADMVEKYKDELAVLDC